MSGQAQTLALFMKAGGVRLRRGLSVPAKSLGNGIARLFESGSERIPRSLLRGKRANGEHHYSLRIEDSPQFTAESFNIARLRHF
jgi:hypothetical protein